MLFITLFFFLFQTSDDDSKSDKNVCPRIVLDLIHDVKYSTLDDVIRYFCFLPAFNPEVLLPVRTAAVAWWLERPPREQEVVGSFPGRNRVKSLKLVVVAFPPWSSELWE